MTTAICGMRSADIRAWLKKMRPKCSRSGKDLGLQRQERAARVDQVDAGQPVLERDLLRADVLLHRDRIVGAALDRRVVGDDQHLAARDPADAGDDARPPGASLSYRSQAASGDSSRNGEPGSSSRSMRSRTGSLPCSRWRWRYFAPPPCADGGGPLAQLGDEGASSARGWRGTPPSWIDVRLEDVHSSAVASIGELLRAAGSRARSGRRYARVKRCSAFGQMSTCRHAMANVYNSCSTRSQLCIVRDDIDGTCL